MTVSSDKDPRRVGTIWAAEFGTPLPLVLPHVSAVFRRVGLESLVDLTAAMGPDSTNEIIFRFSGGRMCCGVRVDGVLAAYGWVSLNEEFIGELNLRLHLLPGEAYIWDCATLPAYRQQGLYSALLAYMLSELKADQIGRVWIGANLENIPSQRGIDRAGFLRVADLLVERVESMRMVWAEAYPGVPGSLVAEARRAFLGDREKIWMDTIQRA